MRQVFRRRRDVDAEAWDDSDDDMRLVGMDELSLLGQDEQPEVGRPWYRRTSVRVLIAVTVLLALAGGAAVVGGQLLVARYAGSVHQEHLLGEAAATPPAGDGSGPASDRLAGPLNLLLTGIDERTEDPASGARSDTIIIAHIPAGHDRAYLISIPRDSRVDIPAYRKTGYSGGTDKINAAFAFGFYNRGGRGGGFELLALTIKQLTGVSFNAGAILNFDGLQSVVDAAGGVDMCVDEETAVPGGGPVYHVGCQHFTGSQALEYVRQRKLIADGDYGRQRHQQQLIAALAKKVGTTGMLTDPLAADRTLRSMGNAVTFDGNGVSLQDWILKLRNINPDNIKMIKTNGGQYTTQVIGGLDFEILTDTTRQLFTAIHDDTLDAFVAAHPDWVSATAAP
jgi:LCP family protein required for cell wall assembly